jgi:hypothetical protein
MDHTTQTVAECEMGRIDMCTCGTMHVHIGNATVRMPMDQFFSFSTMVGEAFSKVMQEIFADSETGTGFSDQSA